MKRDAWKINWDEYKELDYFCRQYEHKKREADALLTIGISTPNPIQVNGEIGEVLPRGGYMTDPVVRTAERRERYLKDVRMIEAAGKMAAEDLSPYLLRAVTRKGGMTRELARGCPCSQTAFYGMRRRFFYILKQMRDGELDFKRKH